MKFPLSSIPQAPLQLHCKFLRTISLQTYYKTLYGKLKSAVDDDPSADTLSVVDPPLRSTPPKSKTSPDGRAQHTCSSLGSIKVTDVIVNVPLPSIREQEFIELVPPQTRFPHKVTLDVATGMSPILQLRPDFGLKISAVLREPLLNPPTVRIPEAKHIITLYSMI